MGFGKLWICALVFGSLLACSLWVVSPAQAAGEGWQVAQYPQGGQQQGGQKQGGQRQGQQGGNNSCVQSYQRCVMMCAGVGNCVNNCNIGYAVCQQQQGGGS